MNGPGHRTSGTSTAPGAHSSAAGSRALAAIAAAHMLAWFSIESCVLYLLYAGLVGRTDRRAAIAAAVVTGEVVVFTANGFRCPLTDLARSHGADRGSVTDLLLPTWFARNLPAIHVPVLLAIAMLHARALVRITVPESGGRAGGSSG